MMNMNWKKIMSIFVIGMLVFITITVIIPTGVSGVDYIMYRVDGGEWQEYTELHIIYGEGMHLVEFYSVDKAGNMEKAKSEEIETIAHLLDGKWIWSYTLELIAEDT